MRPQNHHTNLSRRASKGEANLPDGGTKVDFRRGFPRAS